jgi:hypothetical protein
MEDNLHYTDDRIAPNENEMVPKALISQYHSGNLIPIIGCQMLPVRPAKKGWMNIHDYIIDRQFACSARHPIPPDNFYELQLLYPQFNQNDIIYFLDSLKEEEKDVTLLDMISRMDKFRVFLMASMFKDFEHSLRAYNKNEKFEVLKNDTVASSQLSFIDFQNGYRKIIYLFDNRDTGMFAINDEDRLEYLFTLAKISEIQGSLLKWLPEKTLLFLGCDFSDWFMRYCIRVLYNRPYEKKPRVYIVNDNSNPLNYRELFFKTHNINLIHKFPVKKFTQEFFKACNSQAEFTDRFFGKKAFISYSSRDRAAAESVDQCLYSYGMGTYFDDRDKEVGTHKELIQEEIMDATTVGVMICVISKELIEEVRELTRPSYVRDVEWWAARVRIEGARMGNRSDRFGIVPYFKDDPTSYIRELPELIRDYFRFGVQAGGCEELAIKLQYFFA